MNSYEKELKNNINRNEKFISEFHEWLKEQKLSGKTIRKHLNNIDIYINDYLNYYEITKMEDGTKEVYMYLDDWFIRKCAFATRTSLIENSTSIKKFYKCMCEKKYVTVEDYNFLCKTINENTDKFLISLVEIQEYEGEEWEGLIEEW